MKTFTPPQRIEALAEYLKISVAELSQKAGYERAQSFYDVQNEKTKNISPKMANNIVNAFPEINRDWLLTGNGNMLIPTTTPVEDDEEYEEEEDELVTFLRVDRKNYDIPLIDISERTGIPQKLLKDFQWGEAELSDEYRERLTYFIEKIKESLEDNAIGTSKGKPTGYYYPEINAAAGFDVALFNSEAMRIPIYLPELGEGVIFINVYGDSMYPKYKSGDMIGIKEVEFLYVVFGHPYVVVFDNGDTNIKYVHKGSDDKHVTLASENPKYEPREYPLSIIRAFFTVKGCINKERM